MTILILVLSGFVGFLFLTFWIIDFTDDHKRKKQDAKDRKKWDNARYQKLKP